MPQALHPDASIRIIQESLFAAGRTDDLNLYATLGDLFPNEQERHFFRETVWTLVRKNDLQIDAGAIPTSPDTTLNDLSRALTFSALPGDPYITKPDDAPPPPPKPKAAGV
jgi:hypothetical protein